MGGGSDSISPSIPSTMQSNAADHDHRDSQNGIQVSVVVGAASRTTSTGDHVKLEDDDQLSPPSRVHDNVREDDEDEADDQDIDEHVNSPVVDAHSGVELLSAHDIVPSPDQDSPPPSLQDEDEDPNETVMIDASDYRGVLNEPTYQTLNGRLTPPGFAHSSSYATLTPLQPLPPISTMSDKFPHYGHHHAGNGGFAIMQNPVTMANYHQQQYDKLGSAIAAAGMNSQGVQLAVNVSIGHHTGHHGSQQHPTLVMTSNGQITSHGHVIQGNISSPFHNGMNSPDKSMSPTNGYEYSNSRNVASVNLGSPQSPSSVNLHSPTSLLQTSLNGLPTTPSPAQVPPSSPTSSSGQQSIQLTSSGHIIAHTQSVFVSSSPSRETKVVTMSSAPPAHSSSHHHSHSHSNQVTVLQAVTPTIVPRAQTVTIVQTPSSGGVNNLAATIVSTPVTVVTSANPLHQNNNLNNQNNNNSNENNNNNGRSSHTKAGNSNSGSNNNKNCVSSSSRSESSATSGDELEEINTKELAQRISAELKRYSIPQAIFAQRVLCRSQGTLSDLLRNPKPWSKLKSGRETFRRMSKWLEEPEFQRMSALRLAGQLFLMMCHTRPLLILLLV